VKFFDADRLLEERGFVPELRRRGLDLATVVVATRSAMRQASSWHGDAQVRRHAPTRRDHQELLLKFREIARRMNLVAQSPRLAQQLKKVEELFAEDGAGPVYPPLAVEGVILRLQTGMGPKGGRPKKDWKPGAIGRLQRQAKVPADLARAIVAAVDKAAARGEYGIVPLNDFPL
jgi:hypothetical protein